MNERSVFLAALEIGEPAVRAAYLDEKLGDTSALENPASLDEIKRAAAAQRD